MRYVIYGAGAVGGTIGARLFEAGHDVMLMARGAHYRALREKGLHYSDPERTRLLHIPVVDEPAAVDWREDDVVLLTVKSQSTDEAVRILAAVGPGSLALVCAQNGVENERVALRRFPNVYGMCVMMPATHLTPGEVDADSLPVVGVLDVGRYPTGTDVVAEAVASDLSASGFRSEADPSIMRWKYDKLLLNLSTALRAACGPEADDDADAAPLRAKLTEALRVEALACYSRAGIVLPTKDERAARTEGAMTMRPIPGRPRVAGSGWQSLARGTGNLESDYLNGEITLLGRLHGVPTPVNEAVQRLSADLARRREPPGSLELSEVAAASDVF
jgi:2-dehydropantoate 2-reductase